MQTVEFAHHGPERFSRGLKNIEVLKQQGAITANIEDSTTWTLAACGRNHRAEERFKEMELNCVASWPNGDGVAEIPVPFSGVKRRDLWPRFGVPVKGGAPPDEVIVPAPLGAS